MARKKTARRKQRDSIAQAITRENLYQLKTHASNSRTWCSEYASDWTRKNDVPLGYGQGFPDHRQQIITGKTRTAKPDFMRAGKVSS